MKTIINGGYLYEKQQLNTNVSIWSVYDRLKESCRLQALKCNKPAIENSHPSWDSDVAKWVEGACEILKREDNNKLKLCVEEIIDDFISNQDNSGYFNSYYLSTNVNEKFTYRPSHELYCVGHWIEAAIAYTKMSNNNRFLEAVERQVDDVYRVFVEEKSAQFVTPYHPEIELALMKLYWQTKKKKYYDLSKFFLESRGIDDSDLKLISKLNNEPMPVGVPNQHNQSHLPINKQVEAVGHAVCALYLYTGISYYAKESKNNVLIDNCKALFDNIVNKKMYITGGVGSTPYGESFTTAYDLPNDEAYCETCAAIALTFFASGMLEIEKDKKYADAIERVLYNGLLSGISLKGDSFFYINPLEMNLNKLNRHNSGIRPKGIRSVIPERAKTFNCFCCPPNVNRFLASVDKLVITKDKDGYYLNLFANCICKDNDSEIIVKTNYPLDSKVKIECKNVSDLFVRIPFWCDDFYISSNYDIKNGYAHIKNPKDVIEIDFKMRPKLYSANVKCRDNYGKVALMNGPIVYCIESVDNGDVYSLSVNADNLNCRINYNAQFKLNEIICNGYKLTNEENSLYSSSSPKHEEIQIKFIPYSAFANRGCSDMLVWINKK